MATLDFEKFKEPGLYLLFDDGRLLTLTRSYIERMMDHYLSDPQLLPPSIREAPAYAPCSVCPKRESAVICHAIPTVFPFIAELDRFLSFQDVIAVFRPAPEENTENQLLHVARTSVQRALQYVSILSLMYYCEVGRIYFKYFDGVNPLMDSLLIVERVYLNIFWDLGGDREAIHALITKMHDELQITLDCQIQRLHLFCKSDAFLNAFVNTSVITQFLKMEGIESFLRSRFDSRNVPPAELPLRQV